MPKGYLATIALPEGYDSAEDFARDCGVELVSIVRRPVAFRIKDELGAWKYYDDERHAASAADRLGIDYQGLYVRDGT